MAIKTKEELLETIRSRIGDDSSDETIAFLEDVTDTFSDLESKAKGDGKDWKAEAERIDAEWRTKYRDRFFNVKPPEDDPDDEPDVPDGVVNMSFEDLFDGKEE